ncbi:MAG: retroviral-like aspartic protease family protein [Sedimenticola sp.]
MIRRDRGLCHGVYIEGRIEGIPILFTVDTGASRTVISEKVYKRMRDGRKPPLDKTSCLVGADGHPIRELGKAMFNMQLGSLEMAREAVVAAIDDDALLGYDVLVGGENGPADILLGQGKLVLDNVEIPCMQVSSIGKSRKVAVADDSLVPGSSEALIGVFIEGNEKNDHDQKSDYLVKTAGHSKDNSHFALGSTVVDNNEGVTGGSKHTHQFSSRVGISGKTEGVISIVATGSSNDKRNQDTIRQVHVAVKRGNTVESWYEKSDPREIPDHKKALLRKLMHGRIERGKEQETRMNNLEDACSRGRLVMRHTSTRRRTFFRENQTRI